MKTRREFLEFMGYGVASGTVLSQVPFLSGCQTSSHRGSVNAKASIPHLPRQFKDEVNLVEGLEYYHLINSGDPINSRGEKFGSHPDFISYLPIHSKNPDDGYLWVNHEYFEPPFISGFQRKQDLSQKTLEQIRREKKEVGGSLLHIRKDAQTKKWQVLPDNKINRRYDASTMIPFSSGQKELKGPAEGTLGNCCGGQTPWGTFLTCEENFHHFYGNVKFGPEGRSVVPAKHPMAWDRKVPRPPEHYGWVCEINPRTFEAKKITALGRFAHEGATVVQAQDGRVVVYMGDDKDDECFYKFVSARPGSLHEGTLYVAVFDKNPGEENGGRGRWEPLVQTRPELERTFKTQTEVLIRTREAAKILGGTPLDRPEDCEVDSKTNHVYLSCTNNKSQRRAYGYILKVKERNADFLSSDFEWSVFVRGSSDENGLSCPDNLAFDPQGNLWVLSDMPDDEGTLYSKMGNNSLFYIPMSGDHQGQVFRLATGPIDSELTGLWFAPDGETAFVSVQHPGSSSPSEKPQDLTSHWPRGGESLPLSSVLVLQGPLMKKLLSGGLS